MAEIARRFPEIDSFHFLGNDSGAGIAWSPCLYPGMNGPTQWRTRNPGERIAGWLRAMQEGAIREGVEIIVNTNSSGLPSGTVAAARDLLAKGQYVNSGNNLERGTLGAGGGSQRRIMVSVLPGRRAGTAGGFCRRPAGDLP